METPAQNTDAMPQHQYKKSSPLIPWLALLGLFGFFALLYYGITMEWSPETVFERAFGYPPPASIIQLRSRTYPALKGCSTFHLVFETDPTTITELLKPDEYSPTDLDNPRIEFLEDKQVPSELKVIPPLDLKAVALYRYTGTSRAQQTIAVDKTRSLVVVHIGLGPGCSP